MFFHLNYCHAPHEFGCFVVVAFYIAFKNKSKKQMVFSFLSVAFVVGWILFVMYSLPASSTKEKGMFEILFYYLNQPLTTLGYFYNTLTDKNHLFGYVYSFIGVLGWLDYNLEPKSFYKFTFGLLFLLSLIYLIKYKFYKKLIGAHSLLIYLAILSVFLMLALELVFWTSFPCKGFIEGTQGRYFISSFTMFAFGLCRENNPKAQINIYAVALLLIYGFISIAVTQYSTILRYFWN